MDATVWVLIDEKQKIYVNRQGQFIKQKRDGTCRFLKGSLHEGYIRHCIHGKKCRAHRVVAYVFLFEGKDEKIFQTLCVHHIDGNKLNNDISNLQIMTNHDHQVLHKGKKGEQDGTK